MRGREGEVQVTAMDAARYNSLSFRIPYSFLVPPFTFGVREPSRTWRARGGRRIARGARQVAEAEEGVSLLPPVPKLPSQGEALLVLRAGLLVPALAEEHVPQAPGGAALRLSVPGPAGQVEGRAKERLRPGVPGRGPRRSRSSVAAAPEFRRPGAGRRTFGRGPAKIGGNPGAAATYIPEDGGTGGAGWDEFSQP